MTKNPFSGLLSDVWSDLSEPGLLWQLATLAACFALGWSLARWLGIRFAIDPASSPASSKARLMRAGAASLFRVLPPLLILALIALAMPVLAQWHRVNLLHMTILLLASYALIRLGFHVLRRVFARRGRLDGFVLLFERGFATLVWLGAALYITGLWPDLAGLLERTILPLGRNKVSLLVILQASVSVLVTLMLALWAGTVLEERLMRIKTVHSSVRAVMARSGRGVLILVAMLFSLSLVGIDLTVLSVFGGALGVGLGLGLQKLASSYVSGFVILLERSLGIGDIVSVDKFHGRITQINTRYTIVRSGDGIETVVPNEMLVSAPVQNYSLTDRSLRLATKIVISYQNDIETALRSLEDATLSVPRVSRTPAPQATLTSFTDKGFELEIGFWINDPENGRANVLSDVNRAIWKTVQAGVAVPYVRAETPPAQAA